MVAVAAAGFRAIAPDYRGYGLSDLPAEPERASFKDITNDLLATLDHLGINKVISIKFNCFLMINLPKCFCSTSGCIISFPFEQIDWVGLGCSLVQKIVCFHLPLYGAKEMCFIYVD